MTFRMPESSLPSTPNARSTQSHPSTTPLVPPPSHLQHFSTTPHVPPPKSAYGSSIPASTLFTRGSGLKSFTLPESSPPRFEGDTNLLEAGDHNAISFHQADNMFTRKNGLMSSMLSSPRGLKRSRNGAVRQQPTTNIALVARSLVDIHKKPILAESDNVILATETLLGDLEMRVHDCDQEQAGVVTSSIASQLVVQWQREYETETKETSIGPDTDTPGAQASYIASFLLQLYHPYSTKPNVRRRDSSIPIPQALLEWLNIQHNPFPDDFETILLHKPSPSADESFWDIVYTSLLRGKLDRVIRLLKDAGWEHAVTALDDGSDQLGYTGKQLQNTRAVIEQCINTISSCPGLAHGNWDVRGSDWSLFRQRVRSAVHELESAAEGGREQETQRENIFAQSARGSLNLSTASRRAESKIPWTVYENLKVLYKQLQGSVDEILLVSQDWLEATIYLTVWWDGNEDRDLSRSMRKRQAAHIREVDVTPLPAYRQQLRNAFAVATSEPEDEVFSVNTLDLVQVGIACAMEDSVNTVISILRTLSLPIASAIADIAILNDWLPSGRPRSRELLEKGFTNDDLLVLSHDSSAASQGDIDRDDLLSTYADLLAQRHHLRSNDGVFEKQGWQLAAAILGRMSDQRSADQKIATLFDRVDIKDDDDAVSILQLCSELSLVDQAQRTAERYADQLADTTRYGSMLIFYARAHAATKLKDVLIVLTSLCLVQSAAMPPKLQLDKKLASLLSHDRSELVHLAAVDSQAASLLASQLSGYATVRRFYDLRDQDLQGSKPKLNPLERKRQAASALLAVITSASDCIRGGLVDASVQSVVPVDGLYILLGEVLPLCGRQRILTAAQIYSLLRVIEDFNASPARIHENADELFKACTQATQPQLRKSQSDVSNTSGLTGSSYDLLTTSSMLLKDASTPIYRSWDWRTGLSGLSARDATSRCTMLMLRIALANELGKST